ncbi:phage integrase [Endozoicomonas elysicola]|uniref:Tyr recombinase domain-containing protein n=1 Tax=Endozoicomonas elysicola TaxID=305900 RepID=A0A081KB92_9GAMM|nr:tyrosine-type recombinase/integrase [Endozoicomonas elysicola]KEI71418.1 hypothetical protein GV64_12300 [Endozoicomonas elysicola]
MSIRKDHKTGKWKVDLQLKRGAKRYRRTYDTKAECNQFVNFIKGQTQLKNKEFIEKEDKRLLSEIIDIWYQGRGQELADGERTRNVLDSMVQVIGDIQARRMTVSRFNEYKAIKRSNKMGKADNQRTVSDKTLNNHLGYLRAVYNYLIEIDEINYQNPLEKAKKIKLQERELAYLTKRQINTLLTEIKASCNNPHVLLITKLCLATGARWGEVESRTMTHLQNGCMVYSQTKGKKVRSIPINRKLYREVEAHFDRYGGFTSSLCSFDRALKRSNIRLPRGQSSHVLRHTFASHFMMNGGNIIVLQRILGHADISMTMRYAKFDPNHFQEAINLNPLSGMDDDTEKVLEETEELFS